MAKDRTVDDSGGGPNSLVQLRALLLDGHKPPCPFCGEKLKVGRKQKGLSGSYAYNYECSNATCNLQPGMARAPWYRTIAKGLQAKTVQLGLAAVASVTLAGVIGLGTGLFSWGSQSPNAWEHHLGVIAFESFENGPEKVALAGRWRVEWFVFDDDGTAKPYKWHDHTAGEWKEYPPEIADVKIRGNRVFCTVRNPLVNEDYWMSGRVSTNETLALTYWGPKGSAGESFGGVMLIKIKGLMAKDIPKQTIMEGTWLGDVHYKDQERGTVKWTRLD